ncbi:preprotein translocase subunit SecE [Clostridium luticellarii]|jgi:preprotein translocase subunit SecE|uniref:Protein translocase subunit SecE n=1 Tax=Clostridium luticellarii TaxID=1691940 RepID=A0A2T0BS68_9CLOT|nr:preprotein translocase subunit SecE [Clostridium luticellarii]MCI1944673.1 preprotein translocase subunit SecE [Clostridium luticellarii]MCI1968170.1 preprotein translocase subunit SecE [Clostridium luticellarii]MCI1995285.1 preprotein translocase subunit SecE [Clostridium luticellarii]MCI2039718.1 preprotein translocase subunit SecE [Clostridium luticellarii]PRR86699.1 preprotein translocase subunit SecE [Clostridium luticellarii]
MAEHDNAKKVKKQVTPEGGFFNFFKGLVAEFKRITWPSKENLKKVTISVIAFCSIYVVIVGIIDFGFNSLAKSILK